MKDNYFHLASQSIFSSLDLAFAKILLKDNFSNQSALVLAYLMALSRQGHLCLEVENNRFFPVLDLLKEEENQELFNAMKESMNQGFLHLPEEIVDHKQVAEEQDEFPVKPLVHFQNRLYLQRNWVYETQVVKNLNRLSSNKPQGLKRRQIQKLLEAEQELLAKQAAAIEKALFQSITIISGGPGTGKTYTAAKLVQIALLQNDFKVVVTAPTGRAVSHFYEKIIEVLGKEEDRLKGATLHSLLGLSKNYAKPFESPDLNADLILVDEASMIDVKLMAYLLSKIKGKTRLVFLGDPSQLPPVETGSIFIDLIQHKKGFCIFLEQALRFKNRDLEKFAKAIYDKDVNSALQILKEGSLSHHALDCENQKVFEKKFLNLVIPQIPKPSFVKPEPSMDIFQKFRILTSLRRGFCGVENLNLLIYRYFMQNSKENDWFAMPILICENNSTLRLYNGMTGLLITQKQNKSIMQPDDLVYFSENKKLRKLHLYALPKYELGYALSVHKSQGSEFDKICLVLPKHSKTFGRELFYTAVTRAKKDLEIIASLSTIESTLQKQIFKNSGLGIRLVE